MIRTQKEAQHLKVGDKLANSGKIEQVVTTAPSRGLSTPTGCIDLAVNGYRKTWSKHVEIAILVEET